MLIGSCDLFVFTDFTGYREMCTEFTGVFTVITGHVGMLACVPARCSFSAVSFCCMDVVLSAHVQRLVLLAVGHLLTGGCQENMCDSMLYWTVSAPVTCERTRRRTSWYLHNKFPGLCSPRLNL